LCRPFPARKRLFFKGRSPPNNHLNSSLDETGEVYYEENTFGPFNGLGRLEKTGKTSRGALPEGPFPTRIRMIPNTPIQRPSGGFVPQKVMVRNRYRFGHRRYHESRQEAALIPEFS
jgi:hypothetical protein